MNIPKYSTRKTPTLLPSGTKGLNTFYYVQVVSYFSRSKIWSGAIYSQISNRILWSRISGISISVSTSRIWGNDLRKSLVDGAPLFPVILFSSRTNTYLDPCTGQAFFNNVYHSFIQVLSIETFHNIFQELKLLLHINIGIAYRIGWKSVSQWTRDIFNYQKIQSYGKYVVFIAQGGT